MVSAETELLLLVNKVEERLWPHSTEYGLPSMTKCKDKDLASPQGDENMLLVCGWIAEMEASAWQRNVYRAYTTVPVATRRE